MFKNYLLVAIRQLRKNRGYSFINIFGLATGMAIALVIGIWTIGEHAVDKSYPNHSRIVEIMQAQRPKGAVPGSPNTYVGYTVSSALNPFLKKDYKDIFAETAMFSWPNDGLLVNGDKSISRQGSWAEYTFPVIFGYHFLSGNAESLRDPSTALISRSAAIALFGNEHAVGKTFKYNNKVPFTVGGVYADQPQSSSLHDVDFFIPMSHQWMNWLTSNTDFENHSCRIFGLLAGNTTAEQATARIKDICTPFVKHNVETYTVMPYEDIYLHFDSSNGIGEGRIAFVRLLGIIGIFVLLLACINFMNLSTARSEQRAREVGIRKTLGSLRGQLIGQFLGESIVVALIAFVLAILLATLSLPWFSSISGRPMTMPWANPTFWSLSLIFTVITGLLAGSYPAFYLSGFRTVKVLKGTFKAGKGASTPRRVLVVAQFSISLALIIGTVTIFRQIQYGKNRPVGYDRTSLINIPINTDSLDNHYEYLHKALLNTGVVENMASSSTVMTSFGQNNWLVWDGMQEEQKNITFRDVWVSADFGTTVGWTVLQGRDFSRDYGTDSNSAIVNEAGARILGFKDPIGKIVKHWGKPYTIIGVTKDMLVNNPYEQIQPAIFLGEGGHNVHIIRIKSGTPIRTALASIESVYKKFNPASPFLYYFNDENYQQKFVSETHIGNLASVFACLAILISCLGLFGLASFVAEQRTKEIGVRKVLGASVVNLWALLSNDFLKLVFLSCIVSMPLSYYFMSRWLQNYALHTSLSIWIFVIAGGGMLAITLATVSYQALKAALMNPVKSLRTE